MTRHSKSLLVVWRLAEFEARHLGQQRIQPAHFFLGILKIVEWRAGELLKSPDPQMEAEVDQDISDLRICTGEFILDTTFTRRFLRGILPSESEDRTGGTLHRSETSRAIFSVADSLARATSSPVLPTHLLLALLETAHPQILTTLEKVDTDPEAFRKYVTSFVSRSRKLGGSP